MAGSQGARLWRGFVLLASLLLSSFGPGLALAAPAPPADPVLAAMQAELLRTTQTLRLEEFDKPYFVGFRVIDRTSTSVTARFGAVVARNDDHTRNAAADIRVGDYRFDSSPDSGDFSFEDGPAFDATSQAPIEDDGHALRATLWLLADQAYKKALSTHLRKRAKKVDEVDEKQMDSFSQEAPSIHVDAAKQLVLDPEAWAALARRVSAKFRAGEGVLDASLRISADKNRVYLVNSEGSRIVKEDILYSIQVVALGRAADGMLLDQGQTFYARSPTGLPSEAELSAMTTLAMSNLKALAAAPIADPYTGPAILEPEATGVFFHETVGHRLAGERQKDENEGRTFKGQLGLPILPSFITVRDDPTQVAFNGKALNGHYRYDDEGVASRNTVLVDKGILRTFLMSRTPVEGATKSNGHGRAQGTQRPVARMGSLFVESTNAVSREALKALLVEEARKQGKPYGLIIRDITGGSTNTSNYGYQAFKGSPRLVYRVDAATGAETLVRGVEMVGTPLTAVNKIMATSVEHGIFNGFCGAESGYVPVSTIAPATLFREIELQRTQREKERGPLLPPPWPSAAPR